MSDDDCKALLKKVDEAQSRKQDMKWLSYLEVKGADRPPVIRELLVYTRQREKDAKMVLLITKPKVEQGQGYLMADRNTFFYDPAVGRWDRKTERDSIAGTGARRSDFDSAHYTDHYDVKCEDEELVGKVKTRRMQLTAKEGIEVAFPLVKLWVDTTRFLELKREDAAVSGKPLRSMYYTSWKKVDATASSPEFWYCPEFHAFDLVDKKSETIARAKTVDFNPIDDAVFTKPWLEKAMR